MAYELARNLYMDINGLLDEEPVKHAIAESIENGGEDIQVEGFPDFVKAGVSIAGVHHLQAPGTVILRYLKVGDDDSGVLDVKGRVHALSEEAGGDLRRRTHRPGADNRVDLAYLGIMTTGDDPYVGTASLISFGPGKIAAYESSEQFSDRGTVILHQGLGRLAGFIGLELKHLDPDLDPLDFSYSEYDT